MVLFLILGLLDKIGHAHLTDFNVAVYFKDGKPLNAQAGCMAYMGFYI